MGGSVNYRDIFFKVFWTGAVAATSAAIAATADLPYWWVPMLAVGLNTALAWLRQQLGETPPTLGPPA